MSDFIRILIVDDHLALRIGLAAMLADNPRMQVVAEAHDGESALAACSLHSPDVVLMDLRIPGGGGVEATMAIRKRWPTTRVLIITTFDSDEDIHRAIQAGASGYLLKGLSVAELVNAIEVVHSGKKIMPPEVAMRLRDRVIRKDLSPRELEALSLMVAGRSNKEIAQQLEIGEESVKTHLKSLFQKLGVADRTQAVVVALRQGIVPLRDGVPKEVAPLSGYIFGMLPQEPGEELLLLRDTRLERLKADASGVMSAHTEAELGSYARMVPVVSRRR